MKIAILFSFCAFQLAVDATVYNLSLFENRIAGGHEEESKESIKYIASISSNINLGGFYDFHHFCGGFAVTRLYIVTAHVCYTYIRDNSVRNYEFFRVQLGVTNINTRTPNPNEQTQNLRRIVLAKEYQGMKTENDSLGDIYSIGILVLKKEIEYEIPMDVISDDYIYTGRLCYVVGWGLRSFYDGEHSVNISNKLIRLEIKIDNPQYCRSEFYKDQYIELYSMCGRPRFGAGKTLKGDYGGPLLNKKGKVVGIAVPSPKAAGRSPSFFLKMSIYKYKIMQWVQELNEIKNHKISYYKHQPVTDE